MEKINTYKDLAKLVLYYSDVSYDGSGGHILIARYGDTSVDNFLTEPFRARLERLLRKKKVNNE